jgi:hypothetical protein
LTKILKQDKLEKPKENFKTIKNVAMRKKVLLILLGIFAICNQTAFAQFYLTQDNADTYVNVRGEGNKIIDKIPVWTIVWEAMPDFEWSGEPNYLYAGYAKGDKIYMGNIHLSRLKDISDSFLELQKKEAENHILFQKDSIAATIRFKKINYGTIAFEEINIKLGENNFSIPKSAYEDLNNFANYSSRAYYDKNAQSLYIIADGGDGAESYVVLWEIKNGKYKERHICCGVPDDLIYLSQKGISKKDAYRYVGVD